MYPVTLINWFTSSSNFYEDSIWFSRYNIIPPMNKDDLILSFHSLHIYFHYPMLQTWSTGTQFHKNRADILACSQSLKEIIQYFTIKYDVIIRFFIIPFIRFRKYSSIPGLLTVFIMSCHWIVSSKFSASIDKVICFLSFILFMWWIILIDF